MHQRINILQIIPQLGSGGAERFITDLSNELARYHKLTLVVFFATDKETFFLKELNSNIQVVFLNKKPGLDFNIFVELHRIIKKTKPNVIHTHLRAFFYLSPFFVVLRRTKFFHTIHSDSFFEGPGHLGVLIKKFFFNFGYSIPIVISKNGQHDFQKVYGFSPIIVQNGRSTPLLSNAHVEVRKFMTGLRNSSNTRILINVGRINIEKNQLVLCNCIKKLSDEGHDLVLVILGRIENHELYKTLREISSRIYFVGEVSNVVDYLKEADAFCMSSVIEGMPIALIEAMMMGLLPICTPVGGINSMIRNLENGLLSQDLSEEKYIDTLKTYLSMSKNDIARISQNTLNSSKEYTIKNCAEKYVEIYGS